jgi:adenylate cyclase
MEDRLPRKLAAILYADVAGYSRLTGDDEDATHRALSGYLDLIAGIIVSHRGQVMHYAGDAVLAKFEAVIDALSSATDIQRQLSERNEDLTDDRKLQFRIGVNLGDVIEDRGDIYGDGVNIAARLESLALSGGICISESVHCSIGNKLNLAYKFMGEQKVKNISQPVRAYEVIFPDGEGAIPKQSVSESGERNVPMVVVLPFQNLSSDPGQQFFTEGMSEDIITELSRFSDIAVIARHSAFQVREKSANLIATIKEKLGVDYIVEGSVRCTGNRVRINVQLISAEKGDHVWAERYDRNMDCIFEIQDEITEIVVSTISGRIQHVETSRAHSRSTTNLTAYQHLIRGLNYHKSGYTSRENFEKATSEFTKALDLDPDFSRARAWRICSSASLWEGRKEEAVEAAIEEAKLVLSQDEGECEIHRLLGQLYLYIKDYKQSEYHFDKALFLNPNHAHVAVKCSRLYASTNRGQKAIDIVERAMKINPLHPYWYWQEYGLAKYSCGQYEQAIEAFNKNADMADYDLAYIAACFEALGNHQEAKQVVKKLLAIEPAGSVDLYTRLETYKDPEVTNLLKERLAAAGLSESQI